MCSYGMLQLSVSLQQVSLIPQKHVYFCIRSATLQVFARKNGPFGQIVVFFIYFFGLTEQCSQRHTTFCRM